MSAVLSISIVSHGHKKYVLRLIEDLVNLERQDIEVILTLNLPEIISIDFDQLPFPVKLIRNADPKGFAANHNSAFEVSSGNNFVIMNPDIKLLDDPFDNLLSVVDDFPDSICAPLIINNKFEIEDSARNFPSPFLLSKKLLSKIFKFSLAPEVICCSDDFIMPDWVAGMFVVVPRAIYMKMQGLSERYHMYYEDVDFCARIRLEGYKVLISKKAQVIHEAQRDSHRKLHYLLWHFQSAFKFFMSEAYIKICIRRMRGV